MNKTTKILVWVIVLLALLNLTTIGTILYQNYHKKAENEDIIVPSTNTTPINGRFFRKELGFDDMQMDKFRALNHPFQEAARVLIFDIDAMKREMFTELNKSDIDTLKVDELEKKIGEHHAQLKHQINDFYLGLKDICNEEQAIKLQNAFEPLFYEDGANNLMRNGNGSGYRHGQGFGRGNNQINNNNSN
jgi:hypothetical protein